MTKESGVAASVKSLGLHVFKVFEFLKSSAVPT
jgi:hypothetical protein